MSKLASPAVNGFEIHSIWTLHENEWNRADGWVICNIQKKIIIFFWGFKNTHLIEKNATGTAADKEVTADRAREVGCKVLRNMKRQNVAVHPKEETCSEDVLDAPRAFC